MRVSYDEMVHHSKEGVIKEKDMLMRTAITVSALVICLLAMSLSAFAYFTSNLSSYGSTITTANFEAHISMQLVNSEGKVTDIYPITSDYKSYKVKMEADNRYKVIVTPTSQNTAKTGFVVITADNCPNTYYTQQLMKDANESGGYTESISFEITVSDTTEVYFVMHWGTASAYDAYQSQGQNGEFYVTQNEAIHMEVQKSLGENETQETPEGEKEPGEPGEGEEPENPGNEEEPAEPGEGEEPENPGNPEEPGAPEEGEELENPEQSEGTAEEGADTKE